jgi:hypothetical protein
LLRKRQTHQRVLTGDMGGSYFLTEMDASRQGCAIPPYQFCRRALYLLPQMSSKIKKYEQLSKRLIDISILPCRTTSTQIYLINNAFNNII